MYWHTSQLYMDLVVIISLIFFRSSPNLLTASRNISISVSPHLPLNHKQTISFDLELQLASRFSDWIPAIMSWNEDDFRLTLFGKSHHLWVDEVELLVHQAD